MKAFLALLKSLFSIYIANLVFECVKWNIACAKSRFFSLRGILSIFVEMTDCKCYYNFKAYISYPVPRAHKSKTYKYIYDSEIHAFNYNN